MVYFFVAAVVCGLLGLYVSGQKNRSVAEGLGLGCLLGPFGVIIEALLPTVDRPRPAPRVDDDRIRELNELPLVHSENQIDEGDVDRFING
jgi:hypothetical protein